MDIRSILIKSTIELKNSGITTPELDAQVLICHVLRKDKAFLLTHPEHKLDLGQKLKIKKLINRRSKKEPIAYITGHKEFYNYDFLVNKHALIPRPESEWLVELAISWIMDHEPWNKKHNQKDNLLHDSCFKILDIGTGSGCLIISIVNELKKQFNNEAMKQFSFYASDISKKALAMARKNAERLLYSSNISEKSISLSSRSPSNNNINFIHSDLFSSPQLDQKFDLIIANLPYVPKTRIKNTELRIKNSLDYEPKNAIFAEDNGASEIKRFLVQAKDRISNNGLILIELDPRNATDIKKCAEKSFPRSKIELQKDLAGLGRYLKIRLSYIADF